MHHLIVILVFVSIYVSVRYCKTVWKERIENRLFVEIKLCHYLAKEHQLTVV